MQSSQSAVLQGKRMALIIVPATPLRRQRHQTGRLGRSRSSLRWSWGQRHALERLREQRFVGTASARRWLCPRRDGGGRCARR